MAFHAGTSQNPAFLRQRTRGRPSTETPKVGIVVVSLEFGSLQAAKNGSDMKIDEIVDSLAPWLAKHRRPAWKPVVVEGDGSPTASKFCGTPWVGPDSPWPDCSVCNQPLSLFLQLDLSDLPEELGGRFGTGLLQLFYCTRDDCQGDGGWEPFADDLSRVRVVHPSGPSVAVPTSPRHKHLPAKQIVGWTRFDDLPTPCEHDELGLIYTYNFDNGTLRLECQELNFDITSRMSECPAEEIANSEPGDKLAGWPAWVQGVEYPSCPKCGNRMTHVFQLDSESNVPFMFGDVGCGHITQCPEHKEVVAFGWACS